MLNNPLKNPLKEDMMGTFIFKYKRVRKGRFSNLFSYSVLLLSFFILIGCSSDDGGSSTTSDTDTTDTETGDDGTGDDGTGDGGTGDGGTGDGGSGLVVKTGYFVDSAVAGVWISYQEDRQEPRIPQGLSPMRRGKP